jgi:hypothetical protein
MKVATAILYIVFLGIGAVSAAPAIESTSLFNLGWYNMPLTQTSSQ